MADEEDFRWMTYAELAQARGITVASVTRMVTRRKWRRQTGNDGLARVAVPIDAISPRDKPGGEVETVAPAVIAALESAIAALREQLSKADSRLESAERRAESAENRADSAQQGLAEVHKRLAELESALKDAEEAAEQARREATEARRGADELRQAEQARAGQGRWARLRLAWWG